MHKVGLPGKPDIVLPKYKTVIFVHGCFWHYHKNCPEGRIPKSNSEFWEKKLLKNIDRDNKNVHDLEKLGWNVTVIWECELKNDKAISNRIEQLKIAHLL